MRRDESGSETAGRTADTFLTAPASQALLAIIEALELTPGLLADRLVTAHLVNQAMTMTSRWDPTTPARLERLAADSPARRPVAEQLVSAPELDWWFTPFDRHQPQLWSTHAGATHLGAPDRSSGGPPTGFERYAHKPIPSMQTSTMWGDSLSALVVASLAGTGDLAPQPFDAVRRVHLTIRPDARIYEITGPAAWAELARTYPDVDPGGHHHLPGPDGRWVPVEPESIVPDWHAVARDWDGVHVSTAGLLTAAEVWTEHDRGRSRFWAWDSEGTYWLRWSFTDATPLPDLPLDDHAADDPLPWSDDAYRWLAALTSPHLLAQGTGPEAIKLRS